MIKTSSFSAIAVLSIVIIFFSSCSEDEEVNVSIETLAVTSITSTTAVGSAQVVSGRSDVKSKGLCWSTSANPTIDDLVSVDQSGNDDFSNIMTNLTPNTTYHVRAYALTSSRTVYGESVVFTTSSYSPQAEFDFQIYRVGLEYFVATAIIVHYEPDKMLESGVCWSLTPMPTITDYTGETGNVRGDKLLPGTKYYTRGYAKFSTGVAYSEERTFTTKTPLFPAGNGATDIDGNSYSSIVVNGTEWMVGDLKTKHYANGDAIPNVLPAADWAALETGAWSTYTGNCQFWHYGVDPTTKVLYNWFAVNDSRNVCPSGWHVASANDWTQLINSVQPTPYASLVVEETGFQIVGMNDARFEAPPSGGYRNQSGFFYCTDLIAPYLYWWSGDEVNAGSAKASGFSSSQLYGQFDGNKKNGYLVRCVKD